MLIYQYEKLHKLVELANPIEFAAESSETDAIAVENFMKI